jgi:polygalacturonase
MIVFFHCSNVRLNGVTLRSAPNWTLHLQDVDVAAISDIQILNNPRIPNNDGIDCMQCRHVRITNCDIQTGDDGLAIGFSENVNVSNCSISSRSAAIRLESTSMSTFTGLTMDTNRGIAVFATNYESPENRPTEDITARSAPSHARTQTRHRRSSRRQPRSPMDRTNSKRRNHEQ